ncbi:MAG: hypothetical protein M1819_005883 [Sarea resinae]|nr:MAG: hypothetical protein M1819_005883 [Sarea resinae]
MAQKTVPFPSPPATGHEKESGEERGGGTMATMASRYRMSERGFNRFTIICGPIAQMLFFLFLPASLQLPPISPSFTPEATAHHYRQNYTGTKGGIALMLLSGMFWPVYTGGVNGQLARIPGINPTVLWAQLGVGSLGGISLMVPSILFATTIYRLDRDPVLTQLLSDLAWFFFSMPLTPFIAQDLLISYAVLSDRRAVPIVPHWVAWINTGLTMTLFPTLGVHCVHHGAVAWNGALTFWVGAAGFGLQVGLLVFFLLKAVVRPDDDDDEPGAAVSATAASGDSSLES